MQYKARVLTAYYEEAPGHDNYQPLADLVVPNLRRYALKNGYVDLIHKIPMINLHQIGFEKFKIIKREFERGDVHLLLCLDMDTLITNHNIRIEDFVDADNDFYITKDINGINAGSFIIKNTEWSRVFVSFLLDNQSEFENEQVAIDFYKNMDWFKGKIKILPHPSINSYPYDYYSPSWGVIGDRKIDRPTHEEGDWHPGDFICHLPGMPLAKRLEIFTKLQEEIIL